MGVYELDGMAQSAHATDENSGTDTESGEVERSAREHDEPITRERRAKYLTLIGIGGEGYQHVYDQERQEVLVLTPDATFETVEKDEDIRLYHRVEADADDVELILGTLRKNELTGYGKWVADRHGPWEEWNVVNTQKIWAAVSRLPGIHR